MLENLINFFIIVLGFMLLIRERERERGKQKSDLFHVTL